MSAALKTFLDAGLIRQALDDSIKAQLATLSVVAELPSTNQALLDAGIGGGELWVCLAEHQTAGRGRRGRRWLAPPRSGLCLSIGYGFLRPPAELASLTLAMGVAAAGVLQAVGIEEVKLKWPNDLTWRGHKLGGILTELSGGDSQQPPTVVVGLGVNLNLPDGGLALTEPQANPAVDLASITTAAPSPSQLAADFINAMGSSLLAYSNTGFAPFFDAFEALDALNDQAVVVNVAGDQLQGIAKGIAADGQLKVQTEAGDIMVMAGDVLLLRPNS